VARVCVREERLKKVVGNRVGVFRGLEKKESGKRRKEKGKGREGEGEFGPFRREVLINRCMIRDGAMSADGRCRWKRNAGCASRRMGVFF
jgi:hypothetical protein